jgi:integrase
MSKDAYGSGSQRQRSPGTWQLRYRGQIKTVICANAKEAQKERLKWVESIDLQKHRPAAFSMKDLFEEYLAHLFRNDRTDILTVRRRIDKHLTPRLGMIDARALGRPEINAYIDSRKKDVTKHGKPVRNGTINRELAIISAARYLAADRLPAIAPIAKLSEEDGIRQGVVSEEVYRWMLRELPAHAQLFWVFGYYTGVRKGELLKLRWEWVDWDAWLIRVPGWFAGERITKNGKTHFIPIYADMREFLKSAFAVRDPQLPCLFQRCGACVKSFRSAFELARQRLELPGLLFHDLRRTAATNLKRQGYSDFEVQQITGHKSPQAFRRYLIPEEHDMRSMVGRLEVQAAEKRETEKKTVGQTLGQGPAEGGADASSAKAPKYKQ